MSPLRERIIAAIAARLTAIRVTAGYHTELGRRVHVATPLLDADDTPAVVLWPGEEEADGVHGAVSVTLPVVVEAVAPIGRSTAPVLADRMLADLIECLTGSIWRVPFSAGSEEPSPGDIVEGVVSGSTGLVESVALSSGAWSAGTAAGVLSLRRVTGAFRDEAADGLTLVGSQISGDSPAALATAGLAKDILYVGGGPPSWPGPGDIAVMVRAEFRVYYRFLVGDPYHRF